MGTPDPNQIQPVFCRVFSPEGWSTHQMANMGHGYLAVGHTPHPSTDSTGCLRFIVSIGFRDSCILPHLHVGALGV
jgi:hypothetical protein